MRDKLGLTIEIIKKRLRVGYLATAPCCFIIFFSFAFMPSSLRAQIIGEIGAFLWKEWEEEIQQTVLAWLD